MKPYYESGGITIYHGDCREIAPTLTGVNAIITDPPYGVGLTSKQHKWFKKTGSGYAQTSDSEDNIRVGVVPVLTDLIGRVGRAVVTPGTRCAWLYPRPDEIGVAFNKAGAGIGRWGFQCAHLILYYGKDPYLANGMGSRPSSFEQSPSDYAMKCEHPCPKPMGFAMWLVNRGSLPGETILDPFMGTGTTMRAAKDLGRKAIGIEIEEKYCELAVGRLAQENLFAG